MRRFFSILFACLLPTISAAQDQTGQLTLGTDSFLAGETVAQTESGIDDLFMAGETITLSQGIGGSAHLAGRRINIEGAVGADLYVAGMDVFLRAPVAGDVTAAGYNLDLDGSVGGTCVCPGPICGSASASMARSSWQATFWSSMAVLLAT